MSYKSVVNDPSGIHQGGPEKDSLERGSVFVEIYSVLKVLMYFCNALASNCVKSSPEQGKIYCHKNYIKFGVGGSKSLVAWCMLSQFMAPATLCILTWGRSGDGVN